MLSLESIGPSLHSYLFGGHVILIMLVGEARLFQKYYSAF